MKNGKISAWGEFLAIVLVLLLTVLSGCNVDHAGLTKHEIAAGQTPDVNPLKGLFPYAADANFPYSLEWFYLPVNAVHLDEGVFDWSALENQLNQVASRGHQAVIRFYYDHPGDVSGIPRFLLDAGVKVRAYDEPVDLGGGGLCPDYADEKMRSSMKEFIAEFGKEYDGDPRIGFITEGLLGFWGEWHNWPFDTDIADGKPDWTIPAEVYEEVYQAFDDAFDTTCLLVREPKADVDNAKYRTGYHDDSFAYATLSAGNGGQEWSYMSRMIEQGVGNAWEYAPIGGEVYPPLQSEYFMEEYYKVTPNPDTDPNADMVNRQDWDACVQESHASFLLCDKVKSYSGTTRENAIEASKSLGYDMQLTAAWYADSIKDSGKLKLNLDIRNNGVAPFYYGHETWPILIGVKQDGVLVKQYKTEWDLSDIPATGKDIEFKHVVDEHGLGGGEYSLCVKVQNPLQGGVIFRFANDGQGEDGWLELGVFSVEGEPVASYPHVEEDVKPFEPVETNVLVDGAGGHYQAENGTMEGVAVFEECQSAEGQMLVGWVGSGTEGTGSVTLENVVVAEDGFYTVDVDYVCGEAFRYGMFDVNGGAENGGSTVSYRFTNTGSWSVLDTRHTVLFLKAGTNSIKFYNNSAWAPSIDCITVSKGSMTGIQAMDGNLSDWAAITDPVWADDQHTVKITSDDAYIYFALELAENVDDWRVKLDSLGDGVNYEVRSDGLYSLSDDADPQKVAEEGSSALHVAQKDNVVEFMIFRGAMETTRKQMGYDLGYCVELYSGGALIHSTNGGEMTAYELVSGALRQDKSKRFSGSELLDWGKIDCSYTDEFQSVWVADDEEYLYFAAEFSDETGSYTDWSIELNTDADCTTGYAMDWVWYWETTGNDYRVDANGLYWYLDDGTTELITDCSDGAVTCALSDGRLEVRLPKDRLNLSSSKTIYYSVIFNEPGNQFHQGQIAGGGERMPAYEQKYVTEPHFSAVNTLYDRWDTVPAAEIAGKHKLWLADDKDYLYIAAEYRYEGITRWQTLMDTVFKMKTGMQSTWPFSPGGADYLAEGAMTVETVEGVLAYQEVSDGNWTFGKQLPDAVSCIVDTEQKTVEIRILKSALSNDERKLVDIVNFGFQFITEDGEAIASSNGGVFLTYKMMTK